jgi:hypothetical protein
MIRLRFTYAVLGVFFLGVTYACAPSSDSPIPQSFPSSPVVWNLSEAPLESVGLDATRRGHDLSTVVDVAIGRTGTVLLGDAADQELRRFSPGGELRVRAGRPGDGPGDLAFLSKVAECDDGAFVALQPRRMTVFESDGRVRHVTIAPDERAVPPQDAAGVNARCDQVTWLSRGRLPFDSLGMLSQRWTLTWTDPTDTVEVRRFVGLQRFRTEVNGMPAMAAIPWQPEPSWAVFDSSIVWTSGADDTLHVWHRRLGWRALPVPLEARAIGPKDREAYATYRAARIAENPPESRSLLPLDALPSVPTRAPTIAGLLADGATRVWVRPYPDSTNGLKADRAPATSGGELWIVVDLQTGPVATVRVPPGLRLLAVSEDRIAGVRETAEGAEHVVVHTLARR